MPGNGNPYKHKQYVSSVLLNTNMTPKNRIFFEVGDNPRCLWQVVLYSEKAIPWNLKYAFVVLYIHTCIVNHFPSIIIPLQLDIVINAYNTHYHEQAGKGYLVRYNLQ